MFVGSSSRRQRGGPDARRSMRRLRIILGSGLRCEMGYWFFGSIHDALRTTRNAQLNPRASQVKYANFFTAILS